MVSALLVVAMALFAIPYILLLLTFLRSRGRSIVTDAGRFTPSVSIVIATHNEEKKINRKIENTLFLEYPRKKLEIVVVDCSEDATPELVKKWAKSIPIIKLVEEPKRRGLATALRALELRMYLRNRLLVLVLLPTVVFLWTIGWILSRLGEP